MSQQVLKCSDAGIELTGVLQQIDFDRAFILTDTNTRQYCLPLLNLPDDRVITIAADDTHKNIESLSSIWNYLCENGATRKSLLIILGGGMVTDIGGFAAATFKRGIRFINIPTTLLGAVDAAVGGKTGINFHGLKNEIGVFAPAEFVLIDTRFFKTLDRENFLSGYAEMLKHGLLDSEAEWNKLLLFDPENIDYEQLRDLLVYSVGIKERIVKADPTEQGIRKALNLGHTIGHAFESLSHEQHRPAAHGYAVVWGLVCELYLSFKLLGFDKDKMIRTFRFIKDYYGAFCFDCSQYDRLYELMQHDKKNESGRINFTLLSDIGAICINQTASKEDIFESLDFYRDFFGC